MRQEGLNHQALGVGAVCELRGYAYSLFLPLMMTVSTVVRERSDRQGRNTAFIRHSIVEGSLFDFRDAIALLDRKVFSSRPSILETRTDADEDMLS